MTAMLIDTPTFNIGDEVIVEDPSFGAVEGIIEDFTPTGAMIISGPQLDDVRETSWTITSDCISTYISARF